MKNWRGVFLGWELIFLSFIFLGVHSMAQAQQTNRAAARSFLDTPAFTAAPEALAVRQFVSNLWQEPVQKSVVPVLNPNAAQRELGTYWSLQRSNLPPLPARIFLELPVYALDDRHFIVDDRAVDYTALQAKRTAEAEAEISVLSMSGMSLEFSGLNYSSSYSETTNLWLEIPPDGLATNYVNVIIHNTSEGEPYTLLTKTDLNLPTWTPELIVTGAVDNATPVWFPQNQRSNLYVWAHAGLPAAYAVIVSQPLDQFVLAEDMVTFSVGAVAMGGGSLTYQWTRNGTNIPGATASSYTIETVWGWHEGDYAVTVSNGDFSVRSRDANLSVGNFTGLDFHTRLGGARQDYRFRSGYTHYIGVEAEFYGHTVIEGGAVIKFDTWYSSARIKIKGTLECRTEPYYPAILTMVDDDSAGPAELLSIGEPHAFTNGYSFLDLSEASGSVVISNLHFRFADHGVSVPLATGQLDIWNCQFYQCNAVVENQAGNNARIGFHNVLLSQCREAVIALTNDYVIEAEHLTANVGNFWIAAEPPSRISLTNSLIYGEFAGGGIVHTQSTLFNVTNGMFEPREYGHYYLTNTSPALAAGTTNISAALLSALRQRTTRAPMQIPVEAKMAGEMALFPTVPRYTHGAPDLGYYYTAVDYLVADLEIKNGTVTIHPGTVIAAGNCRQPGGFVSAMGVWLMNGAHLVSRGMPARPNIFTVASLVQEEPPTYFSWFGLPFGMQWLVLKHNPLEEGEIVPRIEFEHTKVYLPFKDYLAFGGYKSGLPSISYDCLVDWSLNDCALYGGKIFLTRSHPFSFTGHEYLGSSTINWRNSLFENVTIEIDPSRSQSFGTIDCDVAMVAEHNLFRGGAYFTLRPLPASAGNWQFRDNLFDRVHFIRTTNAPLEMDHNAYWPVLSDNVLWHDEILLPLPEGGTNEVTLTSPPPYQSGPYGKYYLPQLTPLYHAGSRTAAEAGLYHYTTRTNQITAGQDHELFGGSVNIGLHYVAATNAQPLDADGDGVADFVEDANGDGVVDGSETDPGLAMTDGVTPDSYSPVYSEMDLDGDGLDGTSEQVLETNPLLQDNPLDLTEVVLSARSGLVRMPLNTSLTLETNAPSLLKVNGFSGNTHVYVTNGNWVAEWDTLQFPNGTHWLSLEFQSGEASVAIGAPKFVTTHNDICFPDGIALGGDNLFVQPQTIHANGTWALAVYDEQGNLFTASSGQVDADGYCLDPNTGERGINISLVDTNGTQFPSQSYATVVTTTNMVDGSTKAITNKISIEGTWIGNRKWIIASQPLGNYGTQINQEIKGMMDFAAEVIQDTYGQSFLYDVSFTASGPSTLRLSSIANWGKLALRLGITGETNTEARNFFYFGHFDGKNLGGNTNESTSISTSDVRRWLGNAADPLKGPNRHPFRFVFIDGCNSASSDLCTAFGIPAKTISSADMRKKGLEPRAFVGWKTYKVTGYGGAFNHAHLDFVKRFWDLWPITNPQTGSPYTLQEALDQAYKEKAPPFFSKPVIYGCPDLLFR